MLVDGEIDPDSVLYGLVDDFGCVFNHFQIYVGNDFVKRWITSPPRPYAILGDFLGRFPQCNRLDYGRIGI